jgi:hypothetical protein
MVRRVNFRSGKEMGLFIIIVEMDRTGSLKVTDSVSVFFIL